MPDLNANDLDAGQQDHRGHRPLMGVEVKSRPWPHGKSYNERQGQGRPGARCTRPPRRSAWSRTTASAPSSTRPSSCTCGSASNVRNADQQLRGTLALPNGTRQGRQDRRLRRRATRPRRPRRPAPTSSAPTTSPPKIEEGLTRLRRRHRDAGHDARRRPPGPRARPAGQDAQPEGRHRSPRTSPRPSSESKAGKVEYRTDRHGDRARAASARRQLRPRSAAERTTRPSIDELIRAKPARRQGSVPAQGHLSASTMGPGIKVDPSCTRDILGLENARPRLRPRNHVRHPRPSWRPPARGSRIRSQARQRRPVNRTRKQRRSQRSPSRSRSQRRSSPSTIAASPSRRSVSSVESSVRPTRPSASSRTPSPSALPTRPTRRRSRASSRARRR